MSRAGPAAALALKTQSKLSAADNDFAATAAAGQALNAANAAAAVAAAGESCSSGSARPPTTSRDQDRVCLSCPLSQRL
jgi:hypothetical protein